MEIIITKKSDKRNSVIIDALRIMAWQNWKTRISEKVTQYNFKEKYAEFDLAWKNHDCHAMCTEELIIYIEDLEFSESEMIHYRNKYYEAKNSYNISKKETLTVQASNDLNDVYY